MFHLLFDSSLANLQRNGATQKSVVKYPCHSSHIDYSYRKNDFNTGTQLNVANYSTLYPVVYFDLRPTKESMTGDEKKLILHYRLNQAATADYRLYAAVLNEDEFVIKQIGNELVVV